MSSGILRVTGEEAYDLIYREHLSMLGKIEQETMHRAMRNSSRIWLSYTDDKISGVCGLIPPTLLSDTAYLWLYTTEHVAEHSFTFIRYSQRVIEEALREFSTIVGHVKLDAPKSRRWIKWLGAEFGDPQDQLIPFTIRAKSWQKQSARSA